MTSIFAVDLFETLLFRRLQERREIYDLISAAAPFQLTLKFGQDNLAFTFGCSAEASIARSWLLFWETRFSQRGPGRSFQVNYTGFGGDLLALFIPNVRP